MNRTTLLEASRRFWWVALIFAFSGGLLAAIPQPETKSDSATSYAATHVILISSNDSIGIINNTLVNQIQTFATRGVVPQQAAVALGRNESDGPSLAAQVSVVVDTSSLAVTISTTQPTPAGAVDLVDAFGGALIGFIAQEQDDVSTARQERLLGRIDTLEQELKDLQTQLARKPDDAVLQAKIDSASRQYSVVSEQYDNVVLDTSRIVLTTLEKGTAIEVTSAAGIGAPKSRSTRAALGLLVGLFVGGAVALMLSRLDRRIRSRSHAEAIFGGAASASIPEVAGSNTALEVAPDRHDQLSDSYRTLRSVVTFSQSTLADEHDGPHAGRVTMVVSSCSGDGKTSIAANLAAAFAETGKRVVAVNADFRRPTLSTRLISPPPQPLPYALEDLTTVPSRRLLRRTSTTNLVLLDLTSVKASPGNLARATARVLPDVTTLADALVIDSSPMGATAEVLDLLPFADTVIVVIRLDHTLASAAQHMIELLRSVSTAMLHLVLVGDSVDRSPYYEYGDGSKPRGRKASAWWR